jgi:hypothetical protein
LGLTFSQAIRHEPTSLQISMSHRKRLPMPMPRDAYGMHYPHMCALLSSSHLLLLRSQQEASAQKPCHLSCLQDLSKYPVFFFTALSRHPKLSFWRTVTQPMAKSFLAMHRILAACWNIWNHSLLVSPWQPRGSCLSCPVDESSMAGSVASTNSSGESLQGTNHPVFPEGCTNHSVLLQQFTAHSLHLFAITSSKFQQATLG